MTPRKSPGATPRAPREHRANGYDHLSQLIGLQRTEPLTREDRDDLDVLIAAAERGFRLSIACTDCGHPLTAPSSIRRHRGPKCAAKQVDS